MEAKYFSETLIDFNWLHPNISHKIELLKNKRRLITSEIFSWSSQKENKNKNHCIVILCQKFQTVM
jgi:hypothetical protein